MFFKDSVKVYTPDYTMFSDTLKYQTETKFITILGPTHIYGDNRTLYSENGWYNTLTSHAELYKNNQINYNNYQGKADTLVVDSLTGTALMYRNIHLYDTINNILIQCMINTFIIIRSITTNIIKMPQTMKTIESSHTL